MRRRGDEFKNLDKMTGEKFNLNWDDFSETSTERFRPLIRDAKFSDVTLVCGDGQRFPGHQVILATGCTLFKNLLEGEASPKPLIFLRGVEADLLQPLLHFLYTGKAQVDEELFENFVTLAEDLGVEGIANNFNFTQNESTVEESEKTEYFDVEEQNTSASQEVIKKEIEPPKIDLPCYVCSKRFDDESNLKKHIKSHKQSRETVSNSRGNITPSASVEKIIVPKKDENGFHNCNYCERKISDPSNFRKHVQASHLLIDLKCNQCDYTTRHESNLSVHYKKKHVKNV